jgi:hypothetical protein
MTVEQYTAQTRKVMQTHMKKPEVIPTLRCLASKYSEMSDHEKAQNYIDRAEKLASDLLPSQNHSESLYNKVCKVELLLRQKNLPHDKIV